MATIPDILDYNGDTINQKWYVTYEKAAVAKINGNKSIPIKLITMAREKRATGSGEVVSNNNLGVAYVRYYDDYTKKYETFFSKVRSSTEMRNNRPPAHAERLAWEEVAEKLKGRRRQLSSTGRGITVEKIIVYSERAPCSGPGGCKDFFNKLNRDYAGKVNFLYSVSKQICKEEVIEELGGRRISPESFSERVSNRMHTNLDKDFRRAQRKIFLSQKQKVDKGLDQGKEIKIRQDKTETTPISPAAPTTSSATTPSKISDSPITPVRTSTSTALSSSVAPYLKDKIFELVYAATKKDSDSDIDIRNELKRFVEAMQTEFQTSKDNVSEIFSRMIVRKKDAENEFPILFRKSMAGSSSRDGYNMTDLIKSIDEAQKKTIEEQTVDVPDPTSSTPPRTSTTTAFDSEKQRQKQKDRERQERREKEEKKQQEEQQKITVKSTEMTLTEAALLKAEISGELTKLGKGVQGLTIEKIQGGKRAIVFESTDAAKVDIVKNKLGDKLAPDKTKIVKPT